MVDSSSVISLLYEKQDSCIEAAKVTLKEPFFVSSFYVNQDKITIFIELYI